MNAKKIVKKIIKKLLGRPIAKPNPKEYSTIVGAGSFVPCQMEAYFLCLNKYVREGDKVLDVGFGLGYGLNTLAIRAAEVSGVDIDEKVLKYCQESTVGKNPKLKELKVYDGYKLDFPDNSFDVISCVDTLEHVEDYDRFLKELMRVSRRGVFISTPNKRPEYTNPDGTPKNYWHLREWTPEELDKILKQYGRVAWNFLNGPFSGPFAISENVQENSLTLSPFVFKNNA